MTAGTVIPARPLAAQAHALRAAAIFLEHAGTAGLAVSVDAAAFITVCVPDPLGDPGTRAALVTALTSVTNGGYVVRSIALGQRDRYRTTGYGQIHGHPVTITTTGARTR
jgi:hypothetical protein